MPTDATAAKRWPHTMRMITKGEREFRRQQEYLRHGTKRATKFLKR